MEEAEIIDTFWTYHHPLEGNCCCPTNLCAWRPNIVYKNRSVCTVQVALGNLVQGALAGYALGYRIIFMKSLVLTIGLHLTFPPVFLGFSYHIQVGAERE